MTLLHSVFLCGQRGRVTWKRWTLKILEATKNAWSSALEQSTCTSAEITLSSKSLLWKGWGDLPLYAPYHSIWIPILLIGATTQLCFLKSLNSESTLKCLLWSHSESAHFPHPCCDCPQHALTGCLWPGLEIQLMHVESRLVFSESIFLVSKGKESMFLALLAPHQLSSLTQINIVCLTCAWE